MALTLAVTGPLGYSGRHIAALALARGHRVVGLTNSADRPDPWGGRVPLRPLAWGEPDAFARSLEGVDALINTYWVRFDHPRFTHAQAVENSGKLFAAAARAGVKRVVHTSITKPDARSPLPYFSGKARVEELLARCGVPHSILRPAVLFGEEPGEDILINNMAWTLRRFPVVGYFGDGKYRLQPIHVDDFARLCLDAAQRAGNELVQAIGPETFTYVELFRVLGEIIGRPRPALRMPIPVVYAVARLVGRLHDDVFLTREEIEGLMQDRLAVDGAPPAGTTRLTDWARRHRNELGRAYASELARRAGAGPAAPAVLTAGGGRS